MDQYKNNISDFKFGSIIAESSGGDHDFIDPIEVNQADANGEVFTKFTSKVSGQKEVVFTVDGEAIYGYITVKPADFIPEDTEVSFSTETSLSVDDSLEVEFTFYDTYGNVVPDVSQDVITLEITVTVTDTELSDKPTVIFVNMVSPENSIVEVAPPDTVVADGKDNITLKMTLKYDENNVIEAFSKDDIEI